MKKGGEPMKDALWWWGIAVGIIMIPPAILGLFKFLT